MTKITWQSTLLAIAFLAFVYGVVWLGLNHGNSFSTVWAALGSVVGVLTGAIPAYFFKQQADSAQQQAQVATEQASKQAAQTAVYAEQLSPRAVQEVHQQLQVRNLL